MVLSGCILRFMVELQEQSEPKILPFREQTRTLQEQSLRNFLDIKGVSIIPQTHPMIIPDFEALSADALGTVFGARAESARSVIQAYVEPFLHGRTVLYPDFPNHDQRRVWIAELEKSFPSEDMLETWKADYERKNQLRRNVIAGVTQGLDLLARNISDPNDPRRLTIKDMQSKINSALRDSDDHAALVRQPDEYDLKPLERKLEIVQFTLSSVGEVFHVLFPQLTNAYPDLETREKDGIPEKIVYITDFTNLKVNSLPIPDLMAA